ncbi:hypothetical protein TorRG33x02_208660 [Trema orientale]|uniref:Uncharacterized protein n=1 Tax=Trema orientale TaxID=63057 RepID=A0A2P5ECM4_TREOI|nr:hypothetical protein TorRG33x02_208660 [Trema orientale]
MANRLLAQLYKVGPTVFLPHSHTHGLSESQLSLPVTHTHILTDSVTLFCSESSSEPAMGNSSSSQRSAARFPFDRNGAVGLFLFVENGVVDVQAENRGVDVVEVPAENQEIDINMAENRGVDVVEVPAENQEIDINMAENRGVDVVEVPEENHGVDVPAENHVVLNGGPPMGNGHLVANGFIEGALFGNFVNGGLNGFVAENGVIQNGLAQNGFVRGGALFGGGGGGGLANGPGAPNPFDEEADLYFGPPVLQYLPPPPWEEIPLNPFLIEQQHQPLGAIGDPVHEQPPLGAGAGPANLVNDLEELVVGAGAAANPVRDPYELVIGMVNPCLSRLAGENLKLEVIQIETDGTGYTLSCLEPNCPVLKQIYVTKPAHNH